MIKWLTRSYKIFTRDEILKPYLNRPYKNVIEMVQKYDSLGVGFKLWRKTWPENSYYIITKVHLEDMRRGKVWGVLTWKGETSAQEEEIRSVLKLGTWRYSKNES